MLPDLLLCVYIAFLCSTAGRASGAGVELRVNKQMTNGVHHFMENEAATFNCSPEKIARVVTYITRSKQTTVIHFKANEPGLIYMKLRQVNNGSTLRCAARANPSAKPRASDTVQLHLQRPGMVKFKVNELIPAVDKVGANNYTRYIYNYYLGEAMRVDVLKPEYSKLLFCTLYKLSPVNEETLIKKGHEIFNVTFKIDDEKFLHYISCEVKKENFTYYTIIEFSKYNPDFVPVLEGVSRASVLLQYTRNGSTTMRYDVGDGRRALRVACPGLPHYSSMPNSNYTTELMFNDTIITAKLSANAPVNWFRLRPEYDIGEITCRWRQPVYGNTTTLLYLVRRGNKRPTSTATSTQWLPYAVVVGAALLVAAAAAACAVRRRRRLDTRPESTTIMLHQERWAHQNSADDVRHTAAPVYAILSRGPTTEYIPGHTPAGVAHPSPMYMNVFTEQVEPTYANGHLLQPTESIDHLYSKPLPKNKKTARSSTADNHIVPVIDNNASNDRRNTDDVTYAELYDRSCSPQVTLTSDTTPYSEIIQHNRT